MKNFNERLRELREECDMTQTELAHELLIDQRSLSFYEIGKYEPNIDTLKRMTIFFNVSSDYLLGLIDERRVLYENKTELLVVWQIRATCKMKFILQVASLSYFYFELAFPLYELLPLIVVAWYSSSGQEATEYNVCNND